MDKKKMANNILEFLIDPTVIPVEKRLYFRPEEQLDNRSYEKAKSEGFLAYRHQRDNSDMYPTRNRKLTRMGGFSMDRKTMIASLDILSKKFASAEDPIATDLRTMALAFSEMPEEEYTARMAKEEEEAPEAEEPAEEGEKKEDADKTAAETFKCPTCGTKVLKQTGYCVKCKKKVKEAAEEAVEEPVVDNWSKEASDAVAKALVADVTGKDITAGKKKGPGIPDGTGPFGGTPQCQMKKEEEKPEEKAAEKKPEEKPAEMMKEEEKAGCKETEAKKEPEEKAAETEKKIEAAKKTEEKVPEEKAAEVNTDILAHEKFEGIELTNAMIASDDIGELSTEEKSRLDLLFQK